MSIGGVAILLLMVAALCGLDLYLWLKLRLSNRPTTPPEWRG